MRQFKWKTYWCFYLFPVIVFLSLSCGTTREKTAATSGGIKRMALDPLGQLYVVTDRNEVIQYRSDGREGFRYNNNTMGALGVIDPANPFSILLYYPDFQTIILLDRTLNEKGRIILSELGLLNIELVALANDNFIWVYDAADLQLKKLDESGKISFESDRLNLLLPQSPRPRALLARHNRLLLNDPAMGVLLFDQFGRLESTLPITGAESLQLIDPNTLVYVQDRNWRRYDLGALQDTPLDQPLPCTKDCQLLIGKEKLYWLEKGNVQQQVFN